MVTQFFFFLVPLYACPWMTTKAPWVLTLGLHINRSTLVSLPVGNLQIMRLHCIHQGAERRAAGRNIWSFRKCCHSSKVSKTLQSFHLLLGFEQSSCFALSAALGGVFPFSFSCSGGCGVVTCFGFNLHFLMINIKYLFTCLWTTQCSLLWNAPFRCLPFSYWFVGIDVSLCIQILDMDLYLSIRTS